MNSLGIYINSCFKSSFNLYFPYETLMILFSASIPSISITRDLYDMFFIPERTLFSKSLRMNSTPYFLAISII